MLNDLNDVREQPAKALQADFQVEGVFFDPPAAVGRNKPLQESLPRFFTCNYNPRMAVVRRTPNNSGASGCAPMMEKITFANVYHVFTGAESRHLVNKHLLTASMRATARSHAESWLIAAGKLNCKSKRKKPEKVKRAECVPPVGFKPNEAESDVIVAPPRPKRQCVRQGNLRRTDEVVDELQDEPSTTDPLPDGEPDSVRESDSDEKADFHNESELDGSEDEEDEQSRLLQELVKAGLHDYESEEAQSAKSDVRERLAMQPVQVLSFA